MKWDINNDDHVYSTYKQIEADAWWQIEADAWWLMTLSEKEQEDKTFYYIFFNVKKKRTYLHISWIFPFYNLVSGSSGYNHLERSKNICFRPTPNHLNQCWGWPTGSQGSEPLLDQSFSWWPVRIVIAVGYVHYRIVTEDGLAYLQGAEHLRPDGYLGVTKSMQMPEVLSPQYFKGYIEFICIHLPQASCRFTIPGESRKFNSEKC